LKENIEKKTLIKVEEGKSVIDELGPHWFDLIEGMLKYDIHSRLRAE
jgi:hypothetical protein